MFNLYFKRIDRDVKLRVAALLEWWANRQNGNILAHQIDVYCVPAPVVKSFEGRFGFAAFVLSRGELRIIVGGMQVPDIERDDWLYHLEENILHELAHYLQFKLGFKFDEEPADEVAMEWHREYLEAKVRQR